MLSAVALVDGCRLPADAGAEVSRELQRLAPRRGRARTGVVGMKIASGPCGSSGRLAPAMTLLVAASAACRDEPQASPGAAAPVHGRMKAAQKIAIVVR